MRKEGIENSTFSKSLEDCRSKFDRSHAAYWADDPRTSLPGRLHNTLGFEMPYILSCPLSGRGVRIVSMNRIHTHRCFRISPEGQIRRCLQAAGEEAGRVKTKSMLEEHLYEWGETIGSNTIEFHISNLRKKLPPDFIHTIRGIGYTIKKADASQ